MNWICCLYGVTFIDKAAFKKNIIIRVENRQGLSAVFWDLKPTASGNRQVGLESGNLVEM